MLRLAEHTLLLSKCTTVCRAQVKTYYEKPMMTYNLEGHPCIDRLNMCAHMHRFYAHFDVSAADGGGADRNNFRSRVTAALTALQLAKEPSLKRLSSPISTI